MTISSSLNAGVAGLSVNATRLAAISDNIANSSTYGYRRVETDFQSLVLTSGGNSYSAGGVQASTRRLVDQGGALATTSNATDLAVRGRGLLPVADSSDVAVSDGDPEMLLVTTGSFRVSDAGYLSTDNGLILMGWPATLDGSIPSFSRDTSDGLEPIQFSRNLNGDPTTGINMSLNLPATQTRAGADGDAHNLSIEYYDNLGISQSILMEFTPVVPATGETNEWSLIMRDTAQNDAVIGEYQLIFDDSRTSGGRLASVTTISGGSYDPVTGSIVTTVQSGPIDLNIGAVGGTRGLSQLSDSFAPIAITKDGSPVGNMISVDVDGSGMVHAVFDTGVTRTIYQVPLVDMPGPNSLIALDRQTYRTSPESGSFFLWDAGGGPTGDIKSFAREESTTDVATELTDMIKTQRAYSSNAKVIQTVDEMLQETTNIKR